MKQLRLQIASIIYPEYARDLGDLKDRNKDLHAQVRDYSAGNPLLPEERVELSRIVAEHTNLIKEQAEITVFIRDNVPEMSQGGFVGMGFAQMVCHLIRKGMGK